MKHDGEGYGCMPFVGLLCFVAAFCGLGWGLLGGVAGIRYAIPWCIACAAVGIFILSVADARTRIALIEKHLGIDSTMRHSIDQEDTSMEPDGHS
jgi:hypothetical protein